MTFLSYILFQLFDVEHVSPISHKHVKCYSLGLALAIDPPPPRGNFVHYNVTILHYISLKMKYVSPLRVAALACNIMLRMLPTKTLSFPYNVSNMTLFLNSDTGLRTSYNTVT